MEAVRAIDPDHMQFLEGNRYSTEFDMFRDPLPNVVYTNHDYASGFMDAGPYPGVSRGEYVDRDALERKFVKRSEYMLEYDIPMWVSEFGPIHTGRPDVGAKRLQVLRDQLDIYKKYNANWAIWTYEGHWAAGRRLRRAGCAMDGARAAHRGQEESPRTGLLGHDRRRSGHIIGPIEELFQQEFPNCQPFPFGVKRYVAQLVRHMLLSEPLVDEFADRFRGVTAEDIDVLMQSFSLQELPSADRAARDAGCVCLRV